MKLSKALIVGRNGFRAYQFMLIFNIFLMLMRVIQILLHLLQRIFFIYTYFMGQSSCIAALQADTHADLKDGESYVNEFNSITPMMTPKVEFQTNKQTFTPPDQSIARLMTKDEITDMEKKMKEQLISTLNSLEPFKIVPDPKVTINSYLKLDYSQQVYLMVNEGYAYCGQWMNGYPFGFGVSYHFNANYIYEGMTEKGLLSGFGRKIISNGSVLQGTFVNGEMTGKGLFKSPKGHSFQGDFVNSRPHGEGMETWADGSTFEGRFVNGVKINGKFTWSGDTSHKGFHTLVESYTGDFKQNLFHGKGRYEWCDGRVYEGDWAFGALNGNGKYSWPNGRHYEGQFENDLRHGEGTMTWGDKRLWKGQWKRGKMDGIGIYIKNGVPCQGEWKDGERIRWLQSTSSQPFKTNDLDGSLDMEEEGSPSIKKINNSSLMQQSGIKFGDTIQSQFASSIRKAPQ